MSDGVEWALHVATLLATLPEGEALPAAKLAEFHGVPPAYLAKHLQALTAAGLTESVSGPKGGYRLARSPLDITVLDIVLAVDGRQRAFRCTEIRQRGPVAEPSGSPTFRNPCGIASAMRRAEDAWRAELAAVTVADLFEHVLTTVPVPSLLAGAEWVAEVQIRRRAR